uniref:Uncharacterized protein n=1 Tax=Ditylenchus dipsaci TaxID=166011 RepID=A0A915E4Q5_9BILA
MQGFTRDRGILVHFDDTSLREFVFIDPPWLCALLRAAISGSSTQYTTQSSIYQHSVVEKQSLYSSLEFALRHFGQMTTHLAADRQNSSGVALVKLRLFRACLLNLLAKFELALRCLNKMVLLASLLPDEYLLRADYPGARVKLYLRYLQKSRNSIDEQPSGNSEVNLATVSTASMLQDARTRRKSSVVTPCASNLLSVPSPPASPKILVGKLKEVYIFVTSFRIFSVFNSRFLEA